MADEEQVEFDLAKSLLTLQLKEKSRKGTLKRDNHTTNHIDYFQERTKDFKEKRAVVQSCISEIEKNSEGDEEAEDS